MESKLYKRISSGVMINKITYFIKIIYYCWYYIFEYLYKQKGIIYVHGRDRLFRPIVILNAYLIDIKKVKYDFNSKDSVDSICQAISYLLGQVVKIMMIPYHIENWIMIIETNKLGISDLPLSVNL